MQISRIISLLLLPFIAGAQQHYGAYIATSSTIKYRASVLKKLELSRTREIIKLSTPTSASLMDSDYCVALNVNAGYIATDTNAYRKQLKSTLSALKKVPLVVVIESEANNKSIYSGNAQQYINMLSAANNVGKELGIKIVDGGGTAASVRYLAFSLLDADAQARYKAMYKYYPTTRTKAAAAFADSIIRFSPCEYVNFGHWYQDTEDTQLLTAYQSYLEGLRKVAVCNDMGTMTGSTSAMLAMLNAFKIRLVIIHSGGVNALQNKDGSLTSMGMAVDGWLKTKAQ